MTGAEAIVAAIRAQGVDTVFSLAGASHTHLLAALDEAGVTILSNRHESGAVGCADGYARAMMAERPERIGVALCVCDQGLANAVGGLAVAHAAGSPVLLLVAAPPRGFAEAAAHIDHDQLELVRPVSKWARTVPNAARIGDYIATAIREALSPRPGPAVLLIPQDLFLADAGAFAPVRFEPPATRANPALLDKAATLLAGAQRPLAIAGIGATRGGAGDGLRALAAAGVPVLGNGTGRGLVAEDGELGFSWPYAQRAAKDADVVLVVGEMLTQRLGFGLPPRFSADAKFIQVDTEPRAFHRNRQIDVALCGDPGAIVGALANRIDARPNRNWLPEALAAKAALMDELAAGDGEAIHPVALGRALQPHVDAGTMLVGDGADIQNWMYGSLRVSRPGGFMDHYPLGAMGSGTPLAVGAAAALAEIARGNGSAAPLTLLVTGDGSMGFHPGELHAAALAGLNLKVVVGNDAAWGTEEHGQREAIGRTINTELGLLPYAKLGEAFGCAGMTCDTPEDLQDCLSAFIDIPGPAVLDVRIDRAAGARLKSDPLANSIVFSDLAEGQGALARGE